MPTRFIWTILLLAAPWLSGCDCEGDAPPRCASDVECPSGEACLDGACVPRVSDGGAHDAGADGGMMACPAARTCGGPVTCCPEGQECVDGFQCLDACATVRCGDNSALCCGAAEICLDGVVCAAACASDEALCGAALDVCCPAGDVCLDAACATPGASCGDDFDCLVEGDYCERAIGRCLPIPDAMCEVRPEFDEITLEVEWHWAGVTRDGKLYENVIAAPVVGDVSGDGVPDVVVPVYYSSASADTVLVALDGASGALLWAIGGADRPDWIASAGLANFDPSDDALEVFYRLHAGGYRVVDGDGTTQLARRTTGGGAAGRSSPSIADLNGDGVPDVVVGCHAMNGTNIADPALDFFDRGACYGSGEYSLTLVANLDADPEPEVTSGGAAYDIDGAELWNVGPHGFPAVADFDGDGRPEVVVVRAGTIVVRDGATGAMLIGPGGTWASGTYAIPGGGTGGAPTVADFDGDGLPEIATAGRAAYAVYDPDCLPMPPRAGGTCSAPGAGTAFILWQAPTQDISSSITGSSVFDFQGDGASEVIYNDECFLHIYDGASGRELLSTAVANSSRTAIEYPLVVDVDRDGNSEIVVPANRDQVARDGCAVGTSGIYVYGDPNDRWVRTRPIWNQHTYHVTNVGDRGEVPRVELDNWTQPGLNNYRQNVQGAGVFNAPNLRVELSVVGVCAERAVRLSALVRNVGARGVPPGVVVTFRRTAPAPAAELGTATTTSALLPGASERVTITVTDIEVDTDLAFEVHVDGAAVSVVECDDTDNTDTGEERCPGLM
ncbi:MAG: VCBS repeat-containing protein [Sandaracinaceae bacterium]|nr:VCBS repeat-containing protein [Sandaracinaceae bacterium]